MLVDVAIAVPDSGPFTYDVPAELAEQVRPGVRVRVPFGSGQRIGCVTGFRDGSDRVLKPVLEVLDQEPILAADLLDLTRWIARYYRCGWGEAIRTALPPGMDARQVRMVFADERLAADPAASADDPGLASFLCEHGTASYDYIIRRFGRQAEADLGRLRRSGLIGIYHVWQKAKTAVKHEQWLAARDGEFSNNRAPAQMKLWRQLNERRLLPPHELASSRAAARKLVALGLAAWEARAVDRLPDAPELTEETVDIVLTDEQERFLSAAAADIAQRTFRVRVLLGVTSSGKTELYLRAAKQALAAGRQVLIMVPEIGLTHQMLSRVRAALGETAVLHSGMGSGERFDTWRLIREKRYRVVVGTRSAVFAPLSDIGLVVVDEEQDSSYKQDDGRPFYHARDAAIVRARAHRALVILGSATPSVETYHKAVVGKFTLSELTVRAAGASLPSIELVDLKAQGGRGRILSASLSLALQECAGQGCQAMLLLNRRGLSPYVQCASCGAILQCPNCSVSLTLHRAGGRLRCHYCGYARRLDTQCPDCKHLMLLPGGWGIQQLEAEVRELLPNEPVLRMDADTTSRKGAQYRILKTFHDGGARILLGTQMIAKGHHFPRVTLVGVVNVDDLLGMPDFRAGERAFQLLYQMAGRAGRGGQPGRVLIQTRIPDHPVLACVAGNDYRGFARWELEQRRDGRYPPFAHLALVTSSSPREGTAEASANEAAAGLRSAPGIEVLGPAPAPLYRLRNQFRWQLVVKYGRPADLERAAASLRTLSAAGGLITVNVEPASLM